VEAAVAEAVAWDFIGRRCDAARPNDTAGTGGVDFEFVTEVRCDSGTSGINTVIFY